VDGQERRLDFKLEPAATAIVEVQDAKGVPVQGATIASMISAENRQLEYPFGARTDKVGVARLDGIPVGLFVARVTLDDNSQSVAHSGPTRVELGGDARFVVRIPEAAQLTIQARDARGHATAIESFTIHDSRGNVVAEEKARGYAGPFNIQRKVPRDKLSVKAQTGARAGSAEVDLTDGVDRTMVLTLVEK
jgi:hypothetical protein